MHRLRRAATDTSSLRLPLRSFCIIYSIHIWSSLISSRNIPHKKNTPQHHDIYPILMSTLRSFIFVFPSLTWSLRLCLTANKIEDEMAFNGTGFSYSTDALHHISSQIFLQCPVLLFF